MGEIGTRQIIVSCLLIGFFVFAIISFGVKYQDEWGANSSILNDSRVNTIYTGVNDTFKSSRNTANKFDGTLYNESIDDKKGAIPQIIFGSIIGITSSFTGIATNIFNALLGPVMQILGLPREISVIVGTVLSIIFLIVTIFLAWRLLRRGD